MVGGISKKELLRSSGIPAHIEEDAANAIGCLNGTGLYRIGFHRMLVRHLEGIVAQPIEAVDADLLIADINGRTETREINIDPIRIFWHAIEEAAVPHNRRIHRILKAIRIARLIERLILMRREVDPEIAAPFGRIRTIAGDQAGYKNGKYDMD